MAYVNRLEISGPIDDNTPKCVLEEICLASSIRFDLENNSYDYRKKCQKKILSYLGESISDKYEGNLDDLRILARFVNAKHKQWRKEVLLKSYKFMMEFINIEKCKEIRTTFEYGLQTSTSPYSLNACVLYKICKVNNLNVAYFTTIEEMASLIQLRFSIANRKNHLMVHHLKCEIYNKISFTASDSELINILTSCSSSDYLKFLNILNTLNELKESKESQESQESQGLQEDFIGVTHDEYFQVTNDILTRNDKTPKNSIEAVIMGALYYKIDLSKCVSPRKEYELLSENTPYFPHDENLKKRLHATSYDIDSVENPYLNYNFNTNFPINMYGKEDLRALCENEGIEVASTENINEGEVTKEDYYTALQLSYLTQTFIHGKQGHIANTTTTYLDDLNDLNYDEIIVYGVRSRENLEKKNEYGIKDTMRAFTYTELCDVFSSYKKFIHPQTREIFSDECIRKLYLLTQKKKRRNETEENYLNRIQLGDEIERIQIYNSSNNDKLEEFLSKYENANDENKSQVEEILTNILHCGMYMRNWDGKGDFPLKTSQTNYEVEKQIIIDDRVTQSLIQLESSVSACKSLGNFILNMPLMEYNSESKVFTVSTDSNEGLTIKDRMRIVRTGENSINTSSCIRLTSNKFCATAFYYMTLIGFKLPFSISEVSHIF